jgi:uncharacterized caspase-like protein
VDSCLGPSFPKAPPVTSPRLPELSPKCHSARTTLGLPDAQVRLAVDERASRSDIQKGLKWLKSNVPTGGRAYFFFAGHGAPDASSGTPYIVPFDGDPKDLSASAIELSEVLRSLGETPAGQALAIVDACFSGAGGRSVLPAGTRPLVRVQSAAPKAKVALFSASSGSEMSGPAPKDAGGLSSSLLAEGLGRGSADIHGDGGISLQELADWVSPRVARQAKEQSRDQHPSLALGSGLKPGDIILGAGLGKR